jgi:hypothetical protein
MAAQEKICTLTLPTKRHLEKSSISRTMGSMMTETGRLLLNIITRISILEVATTTTEATETTMVVVRGMVGTKEPGQPTAKATKELKASRAATMELHQILNLILKVRLFDNLIVITFN